MFVTACHDGNGNVNVIHILIILFLEQQRLVGTVHFKQLLTIVDSELCHNDA